MPISVVAKPSWGAGTLLQVNSASSKGAVAVVLVVESTDTITGRTKCLILSHPHKGVFPTGLIGSYALSPSEVKVIWKPGE